MLHDSERTRRRLWCNYFLLKFFFVDYIIRFIENVARWLKKKFRDTPQPRQWHFDGKLFLIIYCQRQTIVTVENLITSRNCFSLAW